jgi:hypothetical protein
MLPTKKSHAGGEAIEEAIFEGPVRKIPPPYMASPPQYMTISISKNHTIKQSKAKIIRLHSVSLNQGSAEKDSINILF